MNDDKTIKNPIQFLRETGLLFEINRHILHPFGLALAVITENEEGEDPNVGRIMIWDAREDDEGIVYDAMTFIDALERINAFMKKEGLERLEKRKELLGYVVQEHPDPYMKKNGVSLITYNPEFNPDKEDSPDLIAFTVPYGWAEKKIQEWFDVSIAEFLDAYVYDNSEPLYQEALKDGVILKKKFIRDTH